VTVHSTLHSIMQQPNCIDISNTISEQLLWNITTTEESLSWINIPVGQKRMSFFKSTVQWKNLESQNVFGGF